MSAPESGPARLVGCEGRCGFRLDPRGVEYPDDPDVEVLHADEVAHLPAHTPARCRLVEAIRRHAVAAVSDQFFGTWIADVHPEPPAWTWRVHVHAEDAFPSSPERPLITVTLGLHPGETAQREAEDFARIGARRIVECMREWGLPAR